MGINLPRTKELVISLVVFETCRPGERIYTGYTLGGIIKRLLICCHVSLDSTFILLFDNGLVNVVVYGKVIKSISVVSFDVDLTNLLPSNRNLNKLPQTIRQQRII